MVKLSFCLLIFLTRVDFFSVCFRFFHIFFGYVLHNECLYLKAHIYIYIKDVFLFFAQLLQMFFSILLFKEPPKTENVFLIISSN